MADLRADCSQCFALCCVGLTFVRSADFPVDKPAGQPCGNLTDELRCGVHAGLLSRGYAGCVSYDCIGAGQRVSQVTFGGRDWRTHPELAADMFAALSVMRQLHEMLAYLADASARPEAAPHLRALSVCATEVETLAGSPAAELLPCDLDGLRARIGPVLREVSRAVRAGLPGAQLAGVDRAGADLAGAELRGADLRGAELRGANLIGANLTGARLHRADLIGADIRGADLSGADLSEALYVTQAQLNAARGDRRTVLPAGRERPSHWS